MLDIFIVVITDIIAVLVLYFLLRMQQKRELHKNIKEMDTLRDDLVEKENYRQEIYKVINAIAINTELEKMLESIMPQIMENTKSSCSAFYLVNQANDRLEIKHSVGFGKNLYGEFDLNLGEGIVGIYKDSREIRVTHDIPDDTSYVVRSFLGKIKPKSIMAIPIVNQDMMLGVLVLASTYNYTQEQIQTMELMKYYFGVAVFNGINFEKNKRLNNELKFQNKLIQDLNNDLESKVSDRTKFLNDVIDSIKDYAIYAMDKDGIILAWNAGAEYILDFPAEEVRGKHVSYIYHGNEALSALVRKRLDAAVKSGRYAESGWRTRPDGSSYYMEMMLFARYNNSGDVIGFTNVTRDITAFKKVESALWIERELSAKIMETSNCAILLLDEDATVIVANGRAREIFKSMDAVGRSFYSYFKNEKDLRDSLKTVFELGLPVDDITATLRSNNQVIGMDVSIISDDKISEMMLFVKVNYPAVSGASA